MFRSQLRALGVLLAAAVLAGCGGGTGSGGGSGATLVVARVKDAIGLDPSHETDGISLNLANEIYEQLVGFKPGTFQVVPMLAKSWSTSPDGKTWTFALAPNHEFSDGTPVDAAAVKWNFDRWRLAKNHGNFVYAYYASMFGGFDDKSVIANVAAPAKDKVVMTLRSPLGPFLRNLALSSFSIAEPAAVEKDPRAFDTQPVGSGPYMVAEWAKDDHMTLVANPHWSGGTPAYGTVVVRDIPDQSTSVLSLKSGDVDILIDPRPDDAKDLAKSPGIRLFQQPSNNVLYVAMNELKKPWDDVRVRRAVSLAIDKNAIAQNFYALGATVAANWNPDGMLGDDPKLKPAPHDVAGAKALLASAGFPSGFKTDLYYPTSPRPYMPEPQRVAEALQADLKEAGIDVTLQPFEFGVFLQKVQNGEHPMCLIGWSGDNGDPDNFMYPLLDQDSAVVGQAQNYAFWRDPKFHALMMAGQREVVDAKRAPIYAQANDMVADQVPEIPIVHAVVAFAAKSSIVGIVPRPDQVLNFELMKPGAGN